MTITQTLSASKRRALLLTTALVAMTFVAPKAYAVSDLTTPTGEAVVGGAATFDRPVAGLLNVTQTTDRAVINWDNFDIGAKATTNFVQPSAGSLAVNRVLSAGVDPTQILGKLNANGKVMILDRNGVFIGKDAKINVNSIVVGAGDVATSQVMSGSPTIRIDNMAPDATVENKGRITAADAGLVALVAPTVRNSGTITAKLGKVGLGAGKKVIVDMYGDGLISIALDSKLSHALVENSGKIAAQGGMVQMSTGFASKLVDNVINNSGMVDVSSVTVKGGQIILSGKGNVNNSGKLYAQSQLDGGKIKLAGHNVDVSGVANAESFTGKGGRVDVDATENNAVISGDLKASGVTEGGVVKVIAHDITVTSTGDLRAETTGADSTGGHVELDALHTATVDGKLKANGKAFGGLAQINAHDINLDATSQVVADGTAGRGGEVDLFASHNVNANGYVSATGLSRGGAVDVHAHDINVGGKIMAMSDASGGGGRVHLDASHNVTVDGDVNVKGAEGGGGVKVNAHDITVNGFVNAEAFNTGTGGNVNLLATHNAVINGKVKVSGVDGGGEIDATGHGVTVSDTGLLMSESPNGKGGKVVLRAKQTVDVDGTAELGGVNGGGSFKMIAKYVDLSGLINANAGLNGKGGIVSLFGTLNNLFSGFISAKGGDLSGNGGKVIVNTPNAVTGTVNVSAPAGTDGTYTH